MPMIIVNRAPVLTLWAAVWRNVLVIHQTPH